MNYSIYIHFKGNVTNTPYLDDMYHIRSFKIFFSLLFKPVEVHNLQ